MAVLELETEEEAEELESLVAETGDEFSNNNSHTARLQARLKRRTAAVLPRPGGDQLQESSRRMLLSRFLLFLVLALAVWRLIAKEEKEDSLIPPEETDREKEPLGQAGGSEDGEDASLFAKLLAGAADTAPWVDAVRPLLPPALGQIKNYREKNTSLLVNVHVTHHGGTTFCAAIGRAPGINAPERACNNHKSDPLWSSKRGPWRGHNGTVSNIQKIREEDGLHMVSWEFRKPPAKPLAETEWEHPNLVSVFIARDPISRLLAGDGVVSQIYPGLLTATKTRNGSNASSLSLSPHDLWKVYAHDDRYTNNYALRILAGNGCCQGNQTSEQHLETAKTLLQRFTVVLDIACLNQGIEALAQLLGIQKLGVLKRPKTHNSSRERIGHDDIYEYLWERNQMDIRLYDWAKSVSLVDCSKL